MYKHTLQGCEFDHLYIAIDPASEEETMTDFTGNTVRIGDPVVGHNGYYLRKGVVIQISDNGLVGRIATVQEDGATETFNCWRDIIFLNLDEKGKVDSLKYHFESH